MYASTISCGGNCFHVSKQITQNQTNSGKVRHPFKEGLTFRVFNWANHLISKKFKSSPNWCEELFSLPRPAHFSYLLMFGIKIQIYCVTGRWAARTGQESSGHPAGVCLSTGQSYPAPRRARLRGCWLQRRTAWQGNPPLTNLGVKQRRVWAN